MKIREHEIDVDIADELSDFEWEQGKPEGNEFKACSPFRSERKPSFYVNLETGLFIDHGAEEDHWKRGNLVKLLSFLRNESYEEIEDYLLEKYNAVLTDYEGLELKINIQLAEETKPKYFTREELKPYLKRNEAYLLSRGISSRIQKKFIVGYDQEHNNIAFFWLEEHTGKVVNVKFRSTRGKQFFYIKGGQPIRNHIFGLYQALKDECKKVYIVESEIDALYLWEHDIPAIALGGSNLSAAQKKKLLKADIDSYVIATDNDKQGYRIKNSLIRELGGHKALYTVDLPGYANDVNEVKPEDIKKVTSSEKLITLDLNLHLTW